MSPSEVECHPDGAITIRLSRWVRLVGVHPAPAMHFTATEVVRVRRGDARGVGRELRWRIAGAALSRQRAMGWFSRASHRGRWAWVWMTPGRRLLVIETTRRRPALVAVPSDWLHMERATGIEPA